eukprot:scaffold64691_cov30-Tisochrysis_lutea.AAC.1
MGTTSPDNLSDARRAPFVSVQHRGKTPAATLNPRPPKQPKLLPLHPRQLTTRLTPTPPWTRPSGMPRLRK